MSKLVHRIGGFSGLNTGNIEDCYSNVSMKADVNSAGFCGENKGIIRNCLSKGKIRSKVKEKTCGFCARNAGEQKGCFWVAKDNDSSGEENWHDWKDAVPDKELSEKAEKLFEDKDLDNIWSVEKSEQDVKIDLYDSKSEYSVRNNIVEISDDKELLKAAEDINNGLVEENTIFRLTENINLKGVKWTPIGIDTNTKFSCCFDGAGFTVKNFRISARENAYAGFFGCISEKGEVYNLNIDLIMQGEGQYSAAMCAYNDGLIENCVAKSLVRGSRYSGGFVGHNTGTIRR